jgi:peroxiredoxin
MPYSSVGLFFRHCLSLPESRRFLHRIVGPAVLDVCSVGNDSDFSNLTLQSQRRMNSLDWKPLIDQCRCLIESLTRTQPQHVPLSIRKVAYGVFEHSKTFDRADGLAAVASLLLGRFVADSLVSVFEGYGENEECVGIQRKLRICRAILRAVAEVELGQEILDLSAEYNVPPSTLESINYLMDRSGRDIQKFVERLVDKKSMAEALRRNKERLNSSESKEERLKQLIAVNSFCAKYSLTSYFNSQISEETGSDPSPRDESVPSETEIEDDLVAEDEDTSLELVDTSGVDVEPTSIALPPLAAAQLAPLEPDDDSESDDDSSPFPPEEIEEKTLQLPLTDMNGDTVELKDALAQGELVLIVLLRHFGCNMCRKSARELAANARRLESIGIRLVAIGNGTVSSALKFAADVKFEGSIYVDTSLAVYKDLKCHRGNWRTVLFNGSTFKHFFGALSAGYRPKPIQGDAFQLGGAFVVRRGRQIVFATREEFAGDIEVSEIIRVSELLGAKISSGS